MSYSVFKRDSDGKLYETIVEKDPQGNYRPVGPVPVTTCRLCGQNNYNAYHSVCSRCQR